MNSNADWSIGHSTNRCRSGKSHTMTSQSESLSLDPMENQSDHLVRVIDSTTVDVHQHHLMLEDVDDSWLMFDGQVFTQLTGNSPLNQGNLLPTLGTPQQQSTPLGEYDQLDRISFARRFDIDLELPSSSSSSIKRKPFRINAKSLAITTVTDVSKESSLDEIKRKFSIENIQYVCINEEINKLTYQRHIHIQIILKKTVNLKSRFLGRITESDCNYQVTRNVSAWNKLLKEEGQYLEFNMFPSTLSSLSTVSSPSARSHHKTRRHTRRKHEEEIIVKALE